MKTLIRNIIIRGEKQNIITEGGIIKYIGSKEYDTDKIIEAKELFLIPGMIDPHTHIRDLKQVNKEDWLSASKAALKGGIVMFFDMPNTNPPTINLENLNIKREIAKKSLIKYKFNIAATSNNYHNVEEILKLKPNDVSALKIFFAGSNSKEFINDKELIKRYFELSLKYDIPVIIHTEWQKCIEKYMKNFPNPNIFDHNKIRNPECAVIGTEIALKLAKEIGNKIINAHTSLAEELNLIRQYKRKNTNVYCEVSPHHLFLNENILKKTGNFGKVNPPLRTQKDNEALWQGIMDGTVDFIGTDHAPHKIEEKLTDYAKAPSGFPGLETALRLMLNEVNRKKITMEKLIDLTSRNIAKIFKLKNRNLEIGAIADFILIDMKKEWTVKISEFETKAKYSPFEGFTGIGDIVKVFIDGEICYEKI